MKLQNLLQHFVSLFYPKLCVICGEVLIANESYFCLECFLKLPKTNHHLSPDNRATDRFAGKIPVVKGASYLYYDKGGFSQKLIADIKYRDNRKLGEWMGALLAKDWLSSGFFHGTDCLLPVPLHPSKERKRGFNQSEMIARGISQITGIPINTKNVIRKKATQSQTKKSRFERWKSTKDVFAVKDIDFFNNKQVLIVDDVLTTGATLEAVAQSLLKAKNVKISLLSLAIA
ncbi:MAG: ComF family protein [Dysgonamonadaceae bacterium]|jgi:ComF family protein|nr:ComF family protein [Dysgonamonadaceae bacterium]